MDNQWHLPLVGRLLAGLGFLSGLGWAGNLLLKRWRKLRFSEDQVALAIEQSTPGGVQNRLINAVQISRAEHTESQELSDAVVRENCQRLRQMHLEQAAQMRPALVRLGLAGLMVVVGLAFWQMQPELFANAASRILLLSNIDPLYRTTLTIQPVQPAAVDQDEFEARRMQVLDGAGDVAMNIVIKGERPRTLTLLKTVQGKTTTETIAVESTEGPVAYTFRDVARDLKYSVRGGDFRSPDYHIVVPQKTTLARMTVTYVYPRDYAPLESKTVESRSGDLEGLPDTTAEVTFTFDQPLDSISVHGPTVKEPFTRSGAKDAREYTGTIVLDNVRSYRLETAHGSRHNNAHYAIRILKDLEPKLELIGLERRLEVPIDGMLPLRISASDDYGLEKVGLFFRPIGPGSKDAAAGDEGWHSLTVWPAQRKTTFKQDHDLPILSLKMAEGEKVELALRAVDTDPLRKGAWTTGPIHELNVGGDGVALQQQYEQIVRSEKETARPARQTTGACWARRSSGCKQAGRRQRPALGRRRRTSTPCTPPSRS